MAQLGSEVCAGITERHSQTLHSLEVQGWEGGRVVGHHWKWGAAANPHRESFAFQGNRPGQEEVPP